MKIEQLKLPALITILILCAVPVLMQQCQDFGLRPLSDNKLTWEFHNFTDFGVGGECYLCVQIPPNSDNRHGRLIVPCLSSNVIELRISWFSYGTGQTMENEFFLSTVPGCDRLYNSSPMESFSVTNRLNNSFSELSHDFLEVTVADNDVDRVYRLLTSPRLDVERTACIRDITYTYAPSTTSTEPYATTTTSTEPYAPTTTSTEPNAPTNTSTEQTIKSTEVAIVFSRSSTSSAPGAATVSTTTASSIGISTITSTGTSLSDYTDTRSTELTSSVESNTSKPRFVKGTAAAVSKSPTTVETAEPDRELPILLIAVLAGLGLLFCVLVVFGFICLRRRKKSKPLNDEMSEKKEDDEMVYNPVYDSKESAEESKTQMRTSVTYEGIDGASKDYDNDVGAIYNDCYEGFKLEKDDDGTVCNHDYNSKESKYEDTANVTYKGIGAASEDSENEGGMIYNDCYGGFHPDPKNNVDKQQAAKGGGTTSHAHDEHGGFETDNEVKNVRWSIQKVLSVVLPVYGTVDKSKKKGRNMRDDEEANATTGEGEYATFGGGDTVIVAETRKNEDEEDYADSEDTLKRTTPVYGEIDDNDKRNVRWSLKNALTAIPLYGKVETKKKRKHGRDTDPSRGASENSVNSAKPDNRNIYAEVEQ